MILSRLFLHFINVQEDRHSLMFECDDKNVGIHPKELIPIIALLGISITITLKKIAGNNLA